MSYRSNLNRDNAVKQLKKSISNRENLEPDEAYDDLEYEEHDYAIRKLRVQASIANAFIYIGDMIKENNDILRRKSK